MIYFWLAYARTDVKPEITDAIRKAIDLMKEDGVPNEMTEESYRRNYYKWDKREGYREWKDDFWKGLMREGEQYLDKVGMLKSLKDFRYWEAMQMKYGEYSKKSDVKNTNLSVDDFVGKLDNPNKAYDEADKEIPNQDESGGEGVLPTEPSAETPKPE